MTIEDTADAKVESTIETEVDPVCNNAVDANEAREHELVIEFADREYVFCSPRCKREFIHKPTAYAVTGRSEP